MLFEGDAIVNAASEGCITGHGIDGEIIIAGGEDLRVAREQLPLLSSVVRRPTGEAKMTI